MRSIFASVAAVLLLSSLFWGSQGNAGAGVYPDLESDSVWLINQSRGPVGLWPVGQDPWLTILARIHADRLATYNALYHQDLSVPLSWGWNWVGENVAYSSVGLIDAHQALERSPSHLANMRQPEAYAAGTGIAFGHGRLFLVQIVAF